MQKYYLAKLEAQACAWPRPKLVGVQYARRPPTFGALYLAQGEEEEQQQQHKEQANSSLTKLKLATLEITDDNCAKLSIAHEIYLSASAEPLPWSLVADLAPPFNDQLLLEVAQSGASIEQSLHSSCFLLTRTGTLLALPFRINSTDSNAKVLLELSAGATSGGEQFLEFKVARCVGGAHSGEECEQTGDAITLQVHLLSDRCYYYCELRVTSTQLDCVTQLVGRYALDSTGRTGERVRFTRVLVIESHRKCALVALHLSDGSCRVVEVGSAGAAARCVHEMLRVPPSAQQLVLSSRAPDQATPILLTYSKAQLEADCLFIRHHEEQERKLRNNHHINAEEVELGVGEAAETGSDPDGLLPREPSFELESSWRLDLAELEGVRSTLQDDDDDDYDDHDDHEPELNGCLCPIYSPEAEAEVDEQATSWPGHLVLISRHHLLVYCFEQLIELPFNIIYDRAFLTLSGGGEANKQTKNVQQQQKCTIDARLRPKLVHNFKLVGSQPSDALFNLLFLAKPRVHLQAARSFNKLGLIVALSNENHLLAFKLTSAQVVRRTKDTLYQQNLHASLVGARSSSSSSLLLDELQRIESVNLKLRAQLAHLEDDARDAGTGTGSGNRKLDSGTQSIERFIQVNWRPHERVGGLYELQLEWPLLVAIKRVLVLSTANARFLQNSTSLINSKPSPLIKSMEIGEFTGGSDASLMRMMAMNDDHEVRTNQELHHSRCSTTVTWAEVHLHSCASKMISSSQIISNDHSNKLNLKLLLNDGQFNCHLRIFFVLDTPPPPAMQPFERTIKGGGAAPASKQPKVRTTKFYVHQLEVKPLHSYQQAQGSGDDHFAAPRNKLQISGPFSEQQMFTWLNECLDINPTTLQSQAASQSRTFKLHFRSKFTHCFIVIHLQPQADNQKIVSLESDDFVALNLMERHVFKRATNESIKLVKLVNSEHATMTASVESLRQLVGKQLININIYSTLGQSLDYNQDDASAQPLDNNNYSENIDLLMESLLSEAANQLDDMLDIPLEWKQSTNWLERSLRQDLNHVLRSSNAGNLIVSNAPPKKQASYVDTPIDMLCGYIIDALVDYDQLIANKTTSEHMITMRSKLLLIIKGLDMNWKKPEQSTTISQQVQFANKVLDEWLIIKKSQPTV